jgi:hypothetical protein
MSRSGTATRTQQPADTRVDTGVLLRMLEEAEARYMAAPDGYAAGVVAALGWVLGDCQAAPLSGEYAEPDSERVIREWARAHWYVEHPDGLVASAPYTAGVSAALGWVRGIAEPPVPPLPAPAAGADGQGPGR